ncbi:phytoene dehydrogenase [Cordyceps javanica]|nr:phytoene dehydrogenase [Cordyceps javanica]
MTDTDEESDDLDVIPAEDITVAIFCALPYESVAVKYTFDKELCCRLKTIGPRKYIYSFGVIGEHNVVIARPSQMGTVKAAQCAATVSQQFPNVRFALLVGIGAGIPDSSKGGSKRDIRLGDIAVSIPRDGHPGVVEYDYGKYEADGTFVLKGSLDKPHPILISADGALQEDEIMKKNRFRKMLRKIIEKPGYARPESDDILFDETFQHVEGVGCVEYLKDGPQKLMTRDIKPAQPVVHRGLILSGSGVVKNPEDRLRLRRGHADAICFEMEAAGIVDEIPCLVVRGICDYADTHKQDGWHYYAAAVAAAYGRALLLKIYGEDIQGAESMKETMSKMLSLSIDTKTRVQSLQTSAHLDKIIQWLSAPDPSTNLNTAREQHQPGTGQWLLDSETYKAWKTTPASFLWLHGIPGCGKTILSSTVVTDLANDLVASESLLYFYFNFSDADKRSTENAVRSLIDQLYRKSAGARSVVDSLYATLGKGGGQPGHAALQKVLCDMITKCHEVWIVLDGLDECETRGRHTTNSVLTWIENLRRYLPNVHTLITSRPEEDIKASIDAWAGTQEILPLQSGLVADDIDAFIRTKVQQMTRWFRWVACQFDILEDCLDPIAIRIALNSLPQTLDETYNRIWQRIRTEHRSRTVRLLQLLTYSPRPLRIEEAVDAIAIEPASKPRFNPRNRMPFPEEIARYCSSFVSLTASSNAEGEENMVHIQLAHFSVQEYFQSDRLPPDLAVHLHKTASAVSLVDLCLSYLLELDTSLPVHETKEQYPFAQFSAQHWSDSATILEVSSQQVPKAVDEYYGSHDAFILGYKLYPPDEHIPIWSRPEPASPLYYASFAGLSASVRKLLDAHADTNVQCGYLGNALQAASSKGRDSIVQTLIQHGADVNAQGGYYGNALQAAASSKGHDGIVQTLIQHGADVNAQGGYYGNALQAASSEGHDGIVQTLIQHGADVNAQGEE